MINCKCIRLVGCLLGVLWYMNPCGLFNTRSWFFWLNRLRKCTLWISLNRDLSLEIILMKKSINAHTIRRQTLIWSFVRGDRPLSFPYRHWFYLVIRDWTSALLINTDDPSNRHHQFSAMENLILLPYSKQAACICPNSPRGHYTKVKEPSLPYCIPIIGRGITGCICWAVECADCISAEGLIPPPPSINVLDITLSHLILKFQSWIFGISGVRLHYHYSLLYSDLEK